MFNADTYQSVYVAQHRLRNAMLLFYLVFSGDNFGSWSQSDGDLTFKLKEEPDSLPYVSSYEWDMKWKKEIWALAGGHLKAPRMLLLKAGFAPPEAKSSSNVLMKVLTRLWLENGDHRVWRDPNNTARAPQQLLYIEYTGISGTHREPIVQKKKKKNTSMKVFLAPAWFIPCGTLH